MNEPGLFYLRRALALARRGGRTVCPNPLVGAIVVSEGRVVGQGWHERAGEEHAEIRALAQAGKSAQGGTLYVTLEPCNHHGRTGPCTEAVIAAGIREVFFCSKDPNAAVTGGGAKRLLDAGIRVQSGMESAREQELNAPWYYWLKNQRPMLTAFLTKGLSGFAPFDEAVLSSPKFTRLYDKYDGEFLPDSCLLSSGENLPRQGATQEEFLRTLGARGVQSLRVKEPSVLAKLLELGMIARLVTHFRPMQEQFGQTLPPAKLRLLRVRRVRGEPVAVYEVAEEV